MKKIVQCVFFTVVLPLVLPVASFVSARMMRRFDESLDQMEFEFE